ncbi:DUF7714 family protein [Methylocapsa aurea]|uniref:DUF7714 family protein n=1 Tax=Methylocapsa aurea TaxID=663610 RepID=UPI00068F6E15|nr:hypothetical protein [Methylocapsa aurea]
MPASAGLLAPQAKTARPLFKERLNVVPLPYRGVSVQAFDGPMTEHGIADYFLGREAYRRTEFIVLKAPGGGHAVIAVDVSDREPLFAPIVHVEVLALAEACIYVRDPETDCANRSALAALAALHGVSKDQTLICEGKYDHVNFIHHPSPFVLKVVEVAPPEPPKLFDLVRHVLSYADLPPIIPVLERIDLKNLVRNMSAPAFLVPCRSGGLEDLGAPIYYLDERPPERHDWTLIGCERSLQFHRHYYGDEPPRVEMCPRVIGGCRSEPTILKCCLWEFDIEREGEVMVVPWGANLVMIERALRELSRDIDRV